MESENTEKNKNGGVKKVFTYLLLCFNAFLLLLGQIIGMVLEVVPAVGNKDVWATFVQYAEFGGIWITTLFALKLVKKNRPILVSLGKRRGNTLPSFLLGLLLGFLMNGICALSAVLHGDIFLTFNSFNLWYFIFLFVAVFIQSGAEEMVCRGFLFQRLRKTYSSGVVAIIGNSLFFASLHLANDGVSFCGFVDNLLIGILFSVIVYYLESIWCAMALHTAWNFTQNIVLGLPNSGNVLPYSVFRLEGGAKSSFFYDTGFGIEGSPFSLVVIVGVIVLIVLYGRKHNTAPANIWDGVEEESETE